MAEHRIDRRVERTRVALLQAFVALVLQEGYSAVTVDAVAARANVGRSTFYVHFRGKDDILKHSMAYPNREFARVLDAETVAADLVPLMQHFHAQRRLNRVFFDAPLRTLWVRYLAAVLEAKLPRHPRPALPPKLLALQLAELEIGLIAHWLSGHHSITAEAVAEALLVQVRACVSALLPQR